jgi:hypothetical protein
MNQFNTSLKNSSRRSVKYLILTLLFLSSTTIFAQNEKYQRVMQERITAMENINSADGLREISAAFERIADAEKNQWHPYYYAAYTQILSGYILMDKPASNLPSVLDPIADKAEILIKKADALSPENSEIYVVKKMIASIRMMADPMSRYMQFAPLAAQALEKAKKINPDNPRVYFLEGQDKLYTPEQFGGSKTEAKKLFELAMVKFERFTLQTPLDPSWGRSATQNLLNQSNF